MKSWVRNSLRAGVLAAGFLLFASSPAHANDQISLGNSGPGSGNNISVPIAASANLCSNGIGALHGSGAGGPSLCVGNAQNESANRTEDDQISLGNSGPGSGNNVSVPVTAAVNACSNGIGLTGSGAGGSSLCVANAKNGDDKKNHKGHNGYQAAGANTTENVMGNGGNGKGGSKQVSAFNSGPLSGNNVSLPIAAAANVCGNGIGALFGSGAGGSGACLANAQNESANRTEDDQISLGNSGPLSGNNIDIPVSLALNACGNGIGLAGSGAGGSGACLADAQNGDDAKGKKHHGKKNHNGNNAANNGNNAANNGTEAADPSMPAAGDSYLPQPMAGAAGATGFAGVSMPSMGNTVSVPGLS